MPPEGLENRLSADHHQWPVIDAVAAATGDGAPFTALEPVAVAAEVESADGWPERPLSARRLIRQRCSAVAMDGHTHLGRDEFYRLLARVVPSLNPLTFAVLPWRPQVSLALFVHRVGGLPPGLYLLARDADHLVPLRAALNPAFRWERPDGCPGALPLYLLQPGDLQKTAATVSCHQDIAANGVCAFGMLASFEPALREYGAGFYPRLYWETGLIGQILYLEAEAADIRATGIGCYFDDVMHRVLGIQDRSWQSLYHFTIGGAVEDARLQTLPSYFHLCRS
jgi:hypothetical protein